MERISSPFTRPFYWIIPGLAGLGIVVLGGSNIVRLLGRHAWGSVTAITVALVAFTSFLNVTFGVYEVDLGSGALILSRPFRRMLVPMEQVTGIEAPWKSYKMFPVVWLHWRDARGVRRRARFVVSPAQLPELAELRQRLPKNVSFIAGP